MTHLPCRTPPMLVAPRKVENEELMEQPSKALRGKLDEEPFITTTTLPFNDMKRSESATRRMKPSRPRGHSTVFDLIKDHVHPEPNIDDKLSSQLFSVSDELVNMHSKKERGRERKEQAQTARCFCSVSRAHFQSSKLLARSHARSLDLLQAKPEKRCIGRLLYNVN